MHFLFICWLYCLSRAIAVTYITLSILGLHKGAHIAVFPTPVIDLSIFLTEFLCVYVLGLAALEPREDEPLEGDSNSLRKSALQAYRGSHKDSCCVSALQTESQDFFQLAWERHISHLREATRATVLASIVDIGGGGMTSVPRPNSRSTTSPPMGRHSVVVVDGSGIVDSITGGYPGSPTMDSPRKYSEGFVKVDMTSPRHPLRFSKPSKNFTALPDVTPKENLPVEEEEEEEESLTDKSSKE